MLLLYCIVLICLVLLLHRIPLSNKLTCEWVSVVTVPDRVFYLHPLEVDGFPCLGCSVGGEITQLGEREAVIIEEKGLSENML